MNDRTDTPDGTRGTSAKRTFADALPTFLMAMGVVMLIGIVLLVHASLATPALAVNPPKASVVGNGHYQPQTAHFDMLIVPLWVHEQTTTYDYLAKEFAKHGLLSGREAWGFYPGTITVYQGDTVDISLYNPSSDPHTFTVAGFNMNVNIGAQATAHIRFTANKVGTFTYACEVAEHMPFMAGQFVVLPGALGPQS